MTTISLDEFRRDANAVIQRAQRGEAFLVTENGEPSIRLEPVHKYEGDDTPSNSQGLSFTDLAAQWDDSSRENRQSLTNDEIDRIVYGY